MVDLRSHRHTLGIPTENPKTVGLGETRRKWFSGVEIPYLSYMFYMFYMFLALLSLMGLQPKLGPSVQCFGASDAICKHASLSPNVIIYLETKLCILISKSKSITFCGCHTQYTHEILA